MIDGSLKKPFFKRNTSGSVIGLDNKSIWHQEGQGVLMIDSYKEKMNIEEGKVQLKESSSEGLVAENEEEIIEEYEKQIYRQFIQKRNANLNDRYEMNNTRRKRLKRQNNQQFHRVFSFEVDYNYFVKYYWQRILDQIHCNRKHGLDKWLTPIVVWTEIYSVIKGSDDSHEYYTGYVMKNAYLTQSKYKS